MDVLFINTNSAQVVYQDLADKWSAIEPPTWSLLLAESCRAQDFGVGILDAQAEGLTHDETAKRIIDANPTLACFVTYGNNPNSGTTFMSGVYEVAQMVKDGSDIKTMSIGSHTSALPMEVLKHPAIDYIALNEGVAALHGLLRRFSDTVMLGMELEKIPSLGFKDIGPPDRDWET